MRTLLSCLLLTGALVACAEPVLAQGMGGYGGGGMGGEGMGGMGGGGMGGRGGGGHRRGGGGGAGGPGGAQGAPRANLPAPPTLSVAERLTGVLTLAAQAKSLGHATITAIESDHSAVYLLRGAQLTLDTVNLASDAPVSIPDGARDAGLASALLVYGHSTATVNAGSIATTGKNVNAVFLSDPGSQAIMKGVAVTTKASYAAGLVVSDGAKLDGDGLKVATDSDHAPALLLQGGHAVLAGGAYVTRGPVSPAVTASGDLTATNVSFTAAAAGGLFIDGPHAVNLAQTTLTADDVGITLQTSAAAGPAAGQGPGQGPGIHPGERPGPAAPGFTPVAMTAPSDAPPIRTAALTFQDGQLKARRDAFAVSNIKAAITLNHVDVQTGTGVILRAFAASWGEMGRNGGDAMLTTHNQTLTGDFITDVISSIALSLQDNSKFTGKTTSNVDVALDASSTWTLTTDTRVGKLTDAAISGDTVPNIIGNGHTLSYDSRHNAALGGKTYQLAGGGVLAPGAGL